MAGPESGTAGLTRDESVQNRTTNAPSLLFFRLTLEKMLQLGYIQSTSRL